MQINPQEILNRKILVPCEFTKCQQVGIDLTTAHLVDIKDCSSKTVLLNEKIFLPEDVFSTFIHRSSYNRMGVLITGSIYDPGYNGVVGCTIYNLSGRDITISENERIGQMVFYKANKASVYDGTYQNEFLDTIKEI